MNIAYYIRTMGDLESDNNFCINQKELLQRLYPDSKITIYSDDVSLGLSINRRSGLEQLMFDCGLEKYVRKENKYGYRASELLKSKFDEVIVKSERIFAKSGDIFSIKEGLQSKNVRISFQENLTKEQRRRKYEKVNLFKNQCQKELVNACTWFNIAKNVLIEKYEDKDFLENYNFKGTRGIQNKKTSSSQYERKRLVLENAIKKDFCYSIYTFIIAIFEDFLWKISLEILGETFESENWGAYIRESDDKSMEKELEKTFYLSPIKQKKYFIYRLKIKVEDDFWDNWIEYKATRDVIVHNRGVVNSIYIKKAGAKARYKENETIYITDEELEDVIKTLKKFANEICVFIKKYH